MLKHFIDWLYASPLSQLFQTVTWIIPITQCVHIVCLSILFTSMMMLDLRLLGIAGRRHSVRSYAERFMPWLWGALPVLLFSGLILIIAEPNRDLHNVAFYTKMSLIVAASIVMYAFQRGVRHDPGAWENGGRRRSLGRLVGSACIVFWVGIVLCGRLIAYV